MKPLAVQLLSAHMRWLCDEVPRLQARVRELENALKRHTCAPPFDLCRLCKVLKRRW